MCGYAQVALSVTTIPPEPDNIVDQTLDKVARVERRAACFARAESVVLSGSIVGAHASSWSRYPFCAIQSASLRRNRISSACDITTSTARTRPHATMFDFCRLSIRNPMNLDYFSNTDRFNIIKILIIHTFQQRAHFNEFNECNCTRTDLDQL